jgi:hypothetical protein
MDLRAAIHAKPGLTIGVCVALVLVGGLFVWQGTKGRSSGPHYPALGNYYTADEGQTRIADKWSVVPPFDRDGNTYVRVFVFSCSDGKPFAGYLEKFTPEAQAAISSEEMEHLKIAKIQELGDHGLLVKRPGDANWVGKDTVDGAAVINIVCPENQQPAKGMYPDLAAR